jgi:hypothetical protein
MTEHFSHFSMHAVIGEKLQRIKGQDWNNQTQRKWEKTLVSELPIKGHENHFIHTLWNIKIILFCSFCKETESYPTFTEMDVQWYVLVTWEDFKKLNCFFHRAMEK